MQPMKKTLLTLLIALSAVNTDAQTGRRAYDLAQDFGLNTTMTYARVVDLMPLDTAKKKFPDAYKRIQAQRPGAAGDAWMMRLSAYDIMHLQASWSGLGGGQVITDPNAYLVSYNPITIPAGYYMITIPPELSLNEITGAGCGWNAPNGTAHNTVIGIWHEQWNGDPAERHGFTSSTWGKTGGNYYTEGASVENLRVDGRHLAAAGSVFKSSGFRFWQPGTGSSHRQLYSLDCRTAGFEIFNPTPGNFYDLTAMHCVEYGVLHLGGWGSTLFIHGLETDDCGSQFEQLAAYGYAAGGTLFITAKAECGLKAGTVTPMRPQVVGVFRGWFNGTYTVRAIAKNQKVDALFVVEPVTYSSAGAAQEPLSEIQLKGSITEGYSTLVQQIPTAVCPGARWTLPDKRSFDLVYTSENDGEVWKRATKLTREAIACTARLGGTTSTGSFNYTSCTPVYAPIIGGTAPPPPPPACTFSYTAWTVCSSGTQHRTATSSPIGCTGTPPADSLSRTCTVAPPPPPAGQGYDPNDVLVVVNSADPTSAAMGASYVSAWGIPVANLVTVDLGNAEELATASKLTAARGTINARLKEVTVLAMAVPSRYAGGQSITSAVMFGPRTVSNLAVSPLYNYSGLKPRTDKGTAPCFLLRSASYIRKDAHGTRPAGQSILLLAKDETSAPRGKARAGQSAIGLTVWDNRTYSGIGAGNNGCNYVSTTCWKADRNPGSTPIVAAYQSMYYLGDAGTAAWAKGFYGDHVTSWGGYLPATQANGTNAKGQTPLTYHLDKGASMSVGSVAEPWQGSGGSLAQQFVNASIFHPLFTSGKPVGAACYAAVQCPDRMLFVGDPLCAPFR